MIRAVHAIPSYEANPPKSEERFVACLFGDTLFAVNGGTLGTTTVFRFQEGVPAATRTFAYEDPMAAHRSSGGAEPWSGPYSRTLAGSPIDLAACDGRLWLARKQGHAEVDPETLEIRPVEHSAVTRVRDLANGEALVGGHSRVRDGRGSWVLTAVPYASLALPVVRVPASLDQAPVVQGRAVPFPDKLAGVTTWFERTLEPFEITVEDGHALCVARSTHGGSQRVLVSIEIATGNVLAYAALYYEGSDFVPVHTKHGPLVFGDRNVLRLHPTTLAVAERAPRPRGLSLVAHDATRIVVRSKRALVVIETESLTGTLAEALTRMETEIAAATRTDVSVKAETSRASAKAKSKKAALEDPDALTVRSHEATVREARLEGDTASLAELLGKGALGAYGVTLALDITRRAARCAPSDWPALATQALALGLGFFERKLPVDYKTGAYFFTELLALAIMRGDMATRARLVAHTPERFEQHGLSCAAPLAYAFIAASQAEDARALTLLADAENAGTAYAARVRARTADYTTLLRLPLVPVLRALIAGDARAHDEAVADALRKHRKYWGQKRGMNPGDRPLLEDPDGFAAYPLGGSMALARERGLAVKVRSDYVPSFMFAPPLD